MAVNREVTEMKVYPERLRDFYAERLFIVIFRETV